MDCTAVQLLCFLKEYDSLGRYICSLCPSTSVLITRSDLHKITTRKEHYLNSTSTLTWLFWGRVRKNGYFHRRKQAESCQNVDVYYLLSFF